MPAEQGAVATRSESVESLSLELERCRSEARSLEMQVTRKEAELQRAREEQALLKELKTMNQMIIKKKESKAAAGDAEAQRGMRISDESLTELRALEDALKLENKRTEELQSQAATVAQQRHDVERAIDEANERLAAVKRTTNFDVDPYKAASRADTLNELTERKRVLTALHAEQATVLAQSERLTKDIEDLAAIIGEQEETEARQQEAREALAEHTRQLGELEEQIKSYERLRKKKERLLVQQPKTDQYAAVRKIEGDKRVLHSSLSTLRETSVNNSKSILALEVRLRQLETRLAAVDLYLQQVFASSATGRSAAEDEEEEEEEAMEGVEPGASEVPLALFEDLTRALEASRRTVAQRDAQLMESDAAVEQMERKVSVLGGAIASRALYAQLSNNDKDRQVDTLLAHADKMRAEFASERQRLTDENEALRRQLKGGAAAATGRSNGGNSPATTKGSPAGASRRAK